MSVSTWEELCAEIARVNEQLADANAELDRYREEVRNPLASERDHYRHLAEQRYHLHDELFAALPTVDRDADNDTQIRQAVAEIAELKAQLAAEQQAHAATRDFYRQLIETFHAGLDVAGVLRANDAGGGIPKPYLPHERVQILFDKLQVATADRDQIVEWYSNEMKITTEHTIEMARRGCELRDLQAELEQTREALGRAVEIVRAALLTEHTPSENSCGETNFPPYRWTCRCGARGQQIEQLTHAADCILASPLAASTQAREEVSRYTAGRWEHGTIHVSKMWTDQADWFIVYGCDEEGTIERVIGPDGDIETLEPGAGFSTAQQALDALRTEGE